jgi:hypothetical protein
MIHYARFWRGSFEFGLQPMDYAHYTLLQTAARPHEQFPLRKEPLL